MAKAHILVVDDEPEILELLEHSLSRDGYRVSTAASGEKAVAAVKAKQPDLVLLDLMLPGIDGLDVCRQLKADPRTVGVPVIMLTAKAEDADVVAGLELGAHDYVVKPFSPRVLLARVKAVLRRNEQAARPDAARIVKAGDLAIDLDRREVRVKGRQVELTFTEFGLLHYLASRPGRVFTRYQLIDAVRGQDYPATDRSVDVQVVGLRKKLGKLGGMIETVRGVGYRFKDE